MDHKKSFARGDVAVKGWVIAAELLYHSQGHQFTREQAHPAECVQVASALASSVVDLIGSAVLQLTAG